MSVHAAASGTAHVYGAKGWARCWVAIDHPDGWQTRYYHLKNIDNAIDGVVVQAGQRIGDAGQPGSETCGSGTANFRHVHFALWRYGAAQPITGTSIGGYTVHQTGDAYCGYWTRDSDGATVVDARATCYSMPALVNNQVAPPTGTDSDGDGVPDSSDACPSLPGPPENDGCPVSSPSPAPIGYAERSVVFGDFDGDGVDDLAVGVPGEDVLAAADAGAVDVVYGAKGSGLTAQRVQIFHQDSGGTGGLVGAAEAGDYLGASLAVGDFDGDGVDDLAVGVPGEDVLDRADAGALDVVYGSKGAGLAATRVGLLHQDANGTGGLAGTAEAGDNLGTSLSAGDYDHDGVTDLAAGVPGEDVLALTDAGAVDIAYGSRKVGLDGRRTAIFYQDAGAETHLAGSAEPGDYLGASLASGDFDRDGNIDLAIGVPGEDIGTTADAGAVDIVYGTRRVGLTTARAEVFYQDANGSGGLAGAAEANDYLGASLAAGDFDRDRIADLAIGIPGEDVNTIADAGAIDIIYGTKRAGLTPARTQLLYQDAAGAGGLVGTAEAADHLGSALAAGDANRDRASDLGIGVPGEDVGAIADAGAVDIVYGTKADGIASAGGQMFHQDANGIGGLLGAAEQRDHLGGGDETAPFH